MKQDEQPYSAIDILVGVLAPVWVPLLAALWVLGMMLSIAFLILCAIGGSIFVVAGSLLQVCGAKNLGLWLRQVGTDCIKFGGETMTEMGY